MARLIRIKNAAAMYMAIAGLRWRNMLGNEFIDSQLQAELRCRDQSKDILKNNEKKRFEEIDEKNGADSATTELGRAMISDHEWWQNRSQ